MNALPVLKMNFIKGLLLQTIITSVNVEMVTMKIILLHRRAARAATTAAYLASNLCLQTASRAHRM